VLRPMMSPSEPDHSKGVASKSEPHHDDDSSDARMSAGDLRAIHAKSCALVKLADEGGIDEKLSKSWIQSKLTLADNYLTAIHDYIVHDRESTDSEHGDDRGDGGDMGGGFLISIEKKLSK